MLCLIRKRSKVTQIELAKKSGVSVSTIRRIEAGSSPNVSVLRKLACSLGCSIDDLIDKQDRKDGGAA